MEDFSRFLIFEFEISNADPDSRSDALAHTKRIALFKDPKHPRKSIPKGKH
jgi:hypothetical protein|tara:strand:+ start:369 stop:521 length:153 start_codon:yes stop_codon:yes gene_type:complete